MLSQHSSILYSQEPQASIRVQALQSLELMVSREGSQVESEPQGASKLIYKFLDPP